MIYEENVNITKREISCSRFLAINIIYAIQSWEFSGFPVIGMISQQKNDEDDDDDDDVTKCSIYSLLAAGIEIGIDIEIRRYARLRDDEIIILLHEINLWNANPRDRAAAIRWRKSF